MSLTDLGGATVSLLCFLPCSVPQARQSGCLTSLDCLEQRQRRLPLFPVGTIRILVKGLNDFPCIFGRFDEVEKVQVLWTDHAFIGKRLEIDHPVPELLTEKQDRNRLHLARLDQCQRFEGFVEFTKAAGNHRQCARAHLTMNLAQGAVMERTEERSEGKEGGRRG